jgi:hypothetical protein
MKIRLNSCFSLILLLVVLFTSCGRVSENAKIIPNTATNVISIDLLRLYKKSNIRKLKRHPMLLESMRDPNVGPLIKKLVNNPSYSGIDLKKKIFIFDGATASGDGTYTCLSLQLKSSARLQRMIKNFPGKVRIKKHKHYKSIELDRGIGFAWNNRVAIVLFYQGGYRASGNKEKEIARLMDPKRKNSLTRVKKFKSFVREKEDIGVFVNSYAGLRNSMSLARYDENYEEYLDMFKDSYAHYSINFERGKIVSDFKMDFPNKLKRKLNVFNKRGVRNSFTTSITNTGDVYGYYAMSINPNKLLRSLRSIKPIRDGIRMLENEMPSNARVTAASLANMFTGEAVVAIVDFKKRKRYREGADFEYLKFARDKYDEEHYDDYEDDFYAFPTPIFVATVGLKSTGTFKRLMRLSGTRKNGNIYRFGRDEFMVLKSNKLFITNDEDVAYRLSRSGELKKIRDRKVTRRLTRHPVSGYMNLDINAYPQNVKNSVMDEFGFFATIAKRFLSQLDEITVAGNFLDLKMELTFKDKKRNSLALLVDQLAMLSF